MMDMYKKMNKKIVVTQNPRFGVSNQLLIQTLNVEWISKSRQS
jgi:hypothetical protein